MPAALSRNKARSAPGVSPRAYAHARSSLSLPHTADLRRAIGIDHALRVHLDTLPPGLHPFPLLPIVPIDLRGILEVRQLPGLHARWQVLGGHIVVLLVQLVLDNLAHRCELL